MIDPNEHLVFGETYGAAGRSTPDNDAIDALLVADWLDPIRAVLRGKNDGARLYGAKALLARNAVTIDDGHAIAALALEGTSFSGCTMFEQHLATALS